MAVRSFAKAELAAKSAGMDPSAYTVMDLDLASLNNVRMFAKALKAAKVKPDALVCNAAVWYPKVWRSIHSAYTLFRSVVRVLLRRPVVVIRTFLYLCEI